ncbi:hypothetical protein SPRG_03317 [Saprolegnia parasitica CBS 223.65]|uniref:Uncharacterized protein n=1 Tax=Saprolegnia parasitica (strain CBS 223.65) TaxID=695850 RepID=A0A067CNL6_SAPPC|nr:hypothetical protein SPRG_03317 [Saprolegnia parasitica CBS 223.65]KDO32098.1 hypothetical protein SPRG_03317 [Saprolegnia parasitica CBS 223.65]|eukprot:XP_012197284.1 hypothetical protein SPRG_03317 [Saprolegnia parasitica CBS 223.65]
MAAVCVWCQVEPRAVVCVECFKPAYIDVMELCYTCNGLWHRQGASQNHGWRELPAPIQPASAPAHLSMGNSSGAAPPTQDHARRQAPEVIEVLDDVEVEGSVKAQLDAMCIVEDAVQCTTNASCTNEHCTTAVTHLHHDAPCTPGCSAFADICLHLQVCRKSHDCYRCLYVKQRKLSNVAMLYYHWSQGPPSNMRTLSKQTFTSTMRLQFLETCLQLRSVQARLVKIQAPIYMAPPHTLHYSTRLLELRELQLAPANDVVSQYIGETIERPISWWRESVVACVGITDAPDAPAFAVHIAHVASGIVCSEPACTFVMNHRSHQKQCASKRICVYCHLVAVLTQKHKWYTSRTDVEAATAALKKASTIAGAVTPLRVLNQTYETAKKVQQLERERLTFMIQTLFYLVQPHTPIDLGLETFQ